MAANHGTSTDPTLQDVVDIAKEALPFGKDPVREKYENESRRPKDTSVPGITLD
jgi:hypothetical protein